MPAAKPPGMTSEPLVLTTRRSPTGRRIAVSYAVDAAILAALVFRARRGAGRAPAVGFGAFVLLSTAVSIVFNVALWKSAPYRGRFDPRETVVLPDALVDKVREAATDDETRRALSELRSELGLSYADALLAIALIADADR